MWKRSRSVRDHNHHCESMAMIEEVNQFFNLFFRGSDVECKRVQWLFILKCELEYIMYGNGLRSLLDVNGVTMCSSMP